MTKTVQLIKNIQFAPKCKQHLSMFVYYSPKITNFTTVKSNKL